jgi:hypothetical protein
MIFDLRCSMFFYGTEPPVKNAIFVGIEGEESKIGPDVSHWKIEINTIEELIALRDEVKEDLVVTKQNSIIIYDGYLE